MKNVAVIGGGNGAHTLAADLVQRGYSVRMYELPEYIGNLSVLANTKKITVTGVMNFTSEIEFLTDDMAKALDGVSHICVVVPSVAHERLANVMKGIATKDQVMILYNGGCGSLIFRDILGEDCPVVVETNNLPYDTRLKGPAQVYCSGRNPIKGAFLPADAAAGHWDDVCAISPLTAAFEDVLECSLSLVNPSVHSGACVINMGHIEQEMVRGEFCMYEHFTPGCAKLDIAIDRERKAVGKAFGYHLCPLEEFSGRDLDKDLTWKELYMQMHGDPSLTCIGGPHTIWNRYMTEDCPNGLVPWSDLGKICGVETPVIDGIIAIYNIVHEKDWRACGRTAAKLGLAGMSKDEIKEYVKTGKKA